MKVRINGNISKLEVVREILMLDAKSAKQETIADVRYRSLCNRMQWQTRGSTKDLRGKTIIVDKYIGTDIEYEIHEALIVLQGYVPGALKYTNQEKHVEDLMRIWRKENE